MGLREIKQKLTKQESKSKLRIKIKRERLKMLIKKTSNLAKKLKFQIKKSEKYSRRI